MLTALFLLALLVALCVSLYFLNKTRSAIKEILRLLKEYHTGNMSALLFLKGEGHAGELAVQIANVLEKNQRQIAEAEGKTQMLEATLRGMSDGVLMTDKTGTVILANQCLKRLFEVRSNPEGKKILEVIRNSALVGLFRRSLETWEVITEEIELTVNERDIYVMAVAVPMYSATSVTGVVLTLQDITRLKRLEEIRKDFVANVSHEIKTPITAIRASAETIIESSMDDKEAAIRFLTMIKTHSERLNALVDDLLTLSRIELGDMPIEIMPFDLQEAIDTVMLTFKERVETARLVLIKKTPDHPVIINGDKYKVIQILLNLVDNAIKFTEKGTVVIGVEGQEGKTAFYIEDTGLGIPRYHLDRLGERFYRVDRARSRELGGTGLGLAIVKHLATAQGWQMNIESHLGKGTRVTIITSK